MKIKITLKKLENGWFAMAKNDEDNSDIFDKNGNNIECYLKTRQYCVNCILNQLREFDEKK